MQFFITLAAVVALAVAVPVQRQLVSPGLAGPTPVVDENGSPIAIGPAILDLSPISIGPAILETSPISVGPAIVESNPISVGPAIIEANPIAVGPAIIDFPLPDGGAANEPAIINPSPAIVAPVAPAADSTPLVQIILNINQAAAPVPVSPVVVDQVAEEVFVPGPVNVVDSISAPEPVVEPIVVVEPVIPGPVNIVDNVVIPIEPVQVIEPVIIEPVAVGTPVLPAPAVVLPETLN